MPIWVWKQEVALEPEEADILDGSTQGNTFLLKESAFCSIQAFIWLP